jgi:pantothenate kinase
MSYKTSLETGVVFTGIKLKTLSNEIGTISLTRATAHNMYEYFFGALARSNLATNMNTITILAI